MTKFAKVSLILAGVFIFLGLLIGSIVSVIGGRNFLHLVNEEPIYINNKVLSIGTYEYGWGSNYFGLVDDLIINGNKADGRSHAAYITGDVTDLYISAGACEFALIEWDEDQFYIEIEGRGECDYYVQNGGLYVEGFNNNRVYRNSNNRIYLYAPRGRQYKLLDMELGLGSSDVEGIKAERVNCNVGLGKASFEDITAQKLDLEVGMGECDFKGRVEGDVKVKCGMGTINVELAGREADYNYDLSCAMGSIDIARNKYTTIAGDKRVNNGADYEISAECGMGSINIDFSNDTDDF